MGEEIIKQSFNTSPDTVFGLFIAVLLLIIVSTGIFMKILYSDFKNTRAEEKIAEAKDKEITNARFRELHENNNALQRENQRVLFEVVQANTASNLALVQELASHREIGSRIAEGGATAIGDAKVANAEIKEMLRDIKQMLQK